MQHDFDRADILRVRLAREAEFVAEAEHATVLAQHGAPDFADAAAAGIVDDAQHHDPAEPLALDRAVHLDRVLGPDIVRVRDDAADARSDEHTSGLTSLMRISYAVVFVKNIKK